MMLMEVSFIMNTLIQAHINKKKSFTSYEVKLFYMLFHVTAS